MDNKYIVIKMTTWTNRPTSYSVVSDKAYPLNKACDILVASETMNEMHDTTFHLQEIGFTETDKPLVLTEDMEIDLEKHLHDKGLAVVGKDIDHELI
jgi:hypothetical protein